MSDCQCQSDINRDGSGQLGRFLKALDPSFAPIDGRSMEDLLVFAKRYADQIRFYDIPESNINDPTPPAKISWREFFRRDMAVIAASVATLDTQKIKESYDEIRQQLEQYPTQKLFGSLFDPILGIISRTDRWYSVAIPENPLRLDLELAITSLLREETKKILAYEAGFRLIFPNKPLGLDFSKIENRDVWGLQDPVDPVSDIYTGTTELEKIRHAALFVDDLFLKFYGFITHIVEISDSYMKFALEQYPDHQPHMALFISFLEIFRKAQDQLNGLTEKMLNFYYRDVLKLSEKPSIPDRVNMVFELAKDVNDFDLPKGTRLNAGKDSSGKEQVYMTESDFVINRAKVKELQNFFIEKQTVEDKVNKTSINTIHGFYARPQAKSQDGFGTAITDPSGKWYPFGKGNRLMYPSKNPCELVDQIKEEMGRKDRSAIGFAIASPQLLLQGGKRIIRMSIKGIGRLLRNASGEDVKSPFEFLMTAEKGWLKITRLMPNADYVNISKYLTIGIINPDAENIETSYYIEKDSNTVLIFLPIAEQAIINFDPAIHTGYDFRTTYPVIQVQISPLVQLEDEKYGNLRTDFLGLDIRVGSVFPTAKQIKEFGTPLPFKGPLFDGLKTLVIENDDETIPPRKGKPFDPFTAYPDKGKSLYIGSDEVFNKPLGELAVNMSNNSEFRVLKEKAVVIIPHDLGVSVREDRNWIDLNSDLGKDFNLSLLRKNILSYTDSSGAIITTRLKRRPLLPVTEWNDQVQKGFIRITYLTDIPIIEKAGFLQSSQEVAPKLKIIELSVSYFSSLPQLETGVDQFFHLYPFGVVETYINPTVKGEIAGQPDKAKPDFERLNQQKGGLLVDADNALLPQFTYISPYSVFDKSVPLPVRIEGKLINKMESISQSIKTSNASFDYAKVIAYGAGLKDHQNALNQYSGNIQEEGMLFLGIENTVPLQTLSLLFQFAEGSAMDEDHDPPVIHWSYLSYNNWKPLKGENLIADGTFGFQTTGIVKLGVPEDANDHHTLLHEGLSWFCASVTEHAERIPMLVDIVTQAVEAVFNDNGNDPSHFDSALPAGTISKLAVPANEVSKVVQPFSSFDGKRQEAGREFYTHASERLRHKNRAINVWDYEHLILNRFPVIYKVKCIPHTDPDCLCRATKVRTGRAPGIQILDSDRAGSLLEREFQNLVSRNPEKTDENCCGPQVAPGHVLLVPIANFKNRNAVNPLQPKTGKRTLIEIENYLKNITSPFVHIHARNPVYEEIIVAFKVKFYEGYDRGYYLKKLNEEIVHFLTPWAFDENAEVKFGEKVYASGIINFIEEREYVDFITDFFMAVCREECCPHGASYSKPSSALVKPGEISQAHDIPVTALAKVCSCEELLFLIAGHSKFKGEIVAIPSGPRSILVSVPQHIIIPYEEPEQPSPCDDRIKANAMKI
jgi:hypothetical protein